MVALETAPSPRFPWSSLRLARRLPAALSCFQLPPLRPAAIERAETGGRPLVLGGGDHRARRRIGAGAGPGHLGGAQVLVAD